MRRWNLLLLAISCAGPAAYGEDVWRADDLRPVASISKKIQRSWNNASFVAIGRFVEIQPGHLLQPIDDDKGALEFKFQVERRLDQGKPIDAAVRLKLIVYRPLPNHGPHANKTALAMSRNAERSVSGDTVNFHQYLKMLTKARIPLLSAPNYLQDFFLVPIAVGSLDAPYRVTDVVVQTRKKYVIFVMRDIAHAKAPTLFASDIDIYDADEPTVRKALARRLSH